MSYSLSCSWRIAVCNHVVNYWRVTKLAGHLRRTVVLNFANSASAIRFYRETPCVSAVFAVSRCPSVCLSVTFVYCIQTAEDIVKLFVRPGSPVILVFDPERRYPIPRATPSAGAQNTRGWDNFATFDWNRRLYRKRYEIDPWLLWNVNRISGGSIRVGSDDLQWPITLVSRSLNSYKSNISKTMCLRDKVTIEH